MQKQAYGWLPSISMGLYNMGRNRSLSLEQQAQRAKAQELNEQFRALLALRERPAQEAMTHTRMPTILQAQRTQGLLSGQDMPLGYYDQGMIRMASDMGAELADMHKEAGILDGFGGLLKGVGKGLKGVGKGVGAGLANAGQRGVQAIERSAGNVAKSVSNARSGAASIGPSIKQRVTEFSNRAGANLQSQGKAFAAAGEQKGTALAQRGMGVRPFTTRAATPSVGAGVGNSRGALNTVGTGAPPKQLPAAPVPKQLPQTSSASQARPQTPAQLPAAAPPAQQVPAQKTPVTPTTQAVNNSSAANAPHQPPPAPVQAAVAPAGKPGFLERAQKDLGDGKWKNKLPLLAAAGAASYGLYRGAKGVVNYMGKEHQPERFNEGGVVPPQQVNQYGVPERVN